MSNLLFFQSAGSIISGGFFLRGCLSYLLAWALEKPYFHNLRKAKRKLKRKSQDKHCPAEFLSCL